MNNSRPRKNLYSIVFLLLLSCVHAHAIPFKSVTRTTLFTSTLSRILNVRGGQGETRNGSDPPSESTTTTTEKLKSSSFALPTMFGSLGKAYGAALASSPILTKSVTASAIFGFSDYLAQKFEAGKDMPKYDWTRTLTSMGVGLLYFGPASHAWYAMIFKVFPGTGLFSTLQKAAMGQLFFGPSFMCIFFATSLWQSGQFSLGNWFLKIRRDLPGAWLAGAGFWPVIDLISYSYVPQQYIPLFVNMCSLVWTIYLSSVANRPSPKAD